MNYLDINMIKKQCRIDQDFTDDDQLLEALGDSAESFLEAHLNCALDDICAENSGELPPALYQALLILVSYSYDNDGSGKNEDLPKALWVLTKPWQNYSIA